MIQDGQVLGKLMDIRRTDSLASRLRRKRYEFFQSLAASVGRPMKTLDVGGLQWTWERIGFADQPDVQITLINIHENARGTLRS